jgi:hypothetical protein
MIPIANVLSYAVYDDLMYFLLEGCFGNHVITIYRIKLLKTMTNKESEFRENFTFGP